MNPTFMWVHFPTLEVNGAPKQPGLDKLSSKYLPLCLVEQINS